MPWKEDSYLQQTQEIGDIGETSGTEFESVEEEIAFLKESIKEDLERLKNLQKTQVKATTSDREQDIRKQLLLQLVGKKEEKKEEKEEKIDLIGAALIELLKDKRKREEEEEERKKKEAKTE